MTEIADEAGGTSITDRNIFWESVLVFTILSGAGSALIICLILRGLRKDLSSRLILYLSIADFCLSVICLCLCAYNYHHGHLQDRKHFACRFQPVVTWYFMEVSILWLASISIHSYKVIFYNRPFSPKEEIIFSVICWGIPLVTSILPLIDSTGQSYGPRNDLWCSFNNKKAQLVNLMLYYGPCLLIIGYCYIRIIWEIICVRRSRLDKVLSSNSPQLAEGIDAEKVKVIRKLFFFVSAYFIVWTPMIIAYIYEYVTNRFISFPAEFIVDNLLHVQGMINFVFYGINENLVREIKLWILPFKIKLVNTLSGTFKDDELYEISSDYSGKIELGNLKEGPFRIE